MNGRKSLYFLFFAVCLMLLAPNVAEAAEAKLHIVYDSDAELQGKEVRLYPVAAEEEGSLRVGEAFAEWIPDSTALAEENRAELTGKLKKAVRESSCTYLKATISEKQQVEFDRLKPGIYYLSEETYESGKERIILQGGLYVLKSGADLTVHPKSVTDKKEEPGFFPDTGDPANLRLWCISAMGSGTAILVILILRRFLMRPGRSGKQKGIDKKGG